MDNTYWPGRPELAWDWIDFFASHPHVAYVDVLEPAETAQDIDVYFTDSAEPFALSSLRTDSPVKQQLLLILEL